MPDWMVVRCETRREELAERQIVGLFGKETYLPRFRDWKTGKVKSLYPSYLFVEYDLAWSFLRNVFGAIAPIFVDGTPGRVPEIHIDDLQAQHDSEGLILCDIAVGHRVQVVGGEYVGWRGSFQGMSDNDRCQVLFSMIGQPVLRDIDTRYIRTTH
jgi:transcription antitermination factor NusG